MSFPLEEISSNALPRDEHISYKCRLCEYSVDSDYVCRLENLSGASVALVLGVLVLTYGYDDKCWSGK